MVAAIPAYAPGAASKGFDPPSSNWWDLEFHPYAPPAGSGVDRIAMGVLSFEAWEWQKLYESIGIDTIEGKWIALLEGPEEIDRIPDWEGLGIEIIDIASPTSFVIGYEGPPSRLIGEKGTGIAYLVPFHPLMKLDPYLWMMLRTRCPGVPVPITMGFYPEPSDLALERIYSMSKGEVIVVPEDGLLLSSFLPEDLLELLYLPSVSFLSHTMDLGYDNDVAADIMDVMEVRSTTGLDGTGQIVAVCDTGLDTGMNSTLHGDFKGRIHRAYAYGRTNNWSDADIHIVSGGTTTYKGGHGTHVAGSVLGNGNLSSGNITGMAPNASLVVQSTMNSGGLLSIPSYFSLFDDAYRSGARVHTNSWSSRSNLGNYTGTRSYLIDHFVWNHRNLTVLFSAGNNGPTLNTVSSQSVSKNVICVGASENLRSTFGSSSDNITHIASFSSRGYTNGDGRIKPDVVAPGTYILSTRSSLITDPWNHYWGSQTLYSTLNSGYAYNGGTSMSTPIVAGSAALVRQFFHEERGHKDPSAALVKAAIINGARPLSGDWDSVPNRNEGWGRVNLSNSLCTGDSDAGAMMFIDNSTGLKNGEGHEWTYSVSDGGMDLILTLVWSDYPGSNTSTVKLVNDLDLVVTAPNGTVYNGNDISHPYNDTSDRRNNVERVRIPSPGAGLYRVKVNGYAVSFGPQPYSVVLSGDLTNAVAGLDIYETYLTSDGGIGHVTLSDSNLTGYGHIEIRINSTTDTSGTYINLTELKTGGESSGVFQGNFRVTESTPLNGEVRVSGDEKVTAYYNETYPKRAVTAFVQVLLQPKVHNVGNSGENRNLTYQDVVIFTVNGTKGLKCFVDIPALPSGENLTCRDDGIYPDRTAGDGNYTASYSIPNFIDGDFPARARLQRPPLNDTLAPAGMLSINTSLPRRAENPGVTVLPGGNALRLTWTVPVDPNLQSFWIYGANETEPGSGGPGPFSYINRTMDAGSSYVEGGLIDGVPRFYRIRSYSILGYLSDPTDIVSGIPNDSRAPWIKIMSPVEGQRVRGSLEIVHESENDTDYLIMEGALDPGSDGVPDGPWIQLVNDTTPDDPAVWDTVNDLGELKEGMALMLRARAYDEVGNCNISDPVIGLTVDNDPPEGVTITSEKVAALSVPVYSILGSTEGLAIVRAYSDRGRSVEGRADGTGRFSIYLPLEYGSNMVTVDVYDSVGNGPVTFEETLEITYDPDVPSAVITPISWNNSDTVVISSLWSWDRGPDSGLVGIANRTWTLEWKEEDLVMYGKKIGLDLSEPGILVVSLSLTDHAGNSNLTTIEIEILDDVPPVLLKMENLVIDEDIEFDLGPPLLFENDPEMERYGTYLWNLTGPVDLSVSGPLGVLELETPGSYICRLTVTDPSGNRATADFNITVIDITPPVVQDLADLKGVKGQKLLLDASATSDNSHDFSVSSNFTWTIQSLGLELYGPVAGIVPLTLGVFRVTLKVEDGAGNPAYRSFSLSIEHDGHGPVVIGSYPSSGEENIPTSARIRLEFDQPLDWESIGSVLLYDGESQIVEVSMDHEGPNLTLIPTLPLKRGETYLVEIGAGLMDLSGAPAETLSFEFITVKRLFILSLDGKDPTDTRIVLRGQEYIVLRFSDSIREMDQIELGAPDGSIIYLEVTLSPAGDSITIHLAEDLPDGTYLLYTDSIESRHGERLEDEGPLELDILSPPLNEGRPLPLVPAAVILLLLAVVVIASAFAISRLRRRPSDIGTDEGGSGTQGAIGHRGGSDAEPLQLHNQIKDK